ncbi:MAG: 50S ribosomal protein L32 [Candidatus Omnitrophica bacterium]|nr:50S ribosomal protein L32 [Candidatus Omnitrophota bacterium]
MPNPKRRHSKARGRLRRTFYKLEPLQLGKCPQCGKAKMSHRICPHCGYYKGKQVVVIKTVDEKQKEREKKRTKT